MIFVLISLRAFGMEVYSCLGFRLGWIVELSTTVRMEKASFNEKWMPLIMYYLL